MYLPLFGGKIPVDRWCLYTDKICLLDSWLPLLYICNTEKERCQTNKKVKL